MSRKRPNLGVIPGNFTNAIMKTLFMNLQNTLNNFSGQYLDDLSVTPEKLALTSNCLPVGVIDWPEWSIPLALPADDALSAMTTYDRCSGIFAWNPSQYPTTGGSWYLEAALAIDDAAQTAYCRLMGAAEIGVVTQTGGTLLTVKRSAALTMPTSAANLYVEFKSSSTAATVSFAGARLVFVPS